MSLVLLPTKSLQGRQRELVEIYSISATAAGMEVSKIAGVKEVRLSFTTLAFFTTCWFVFFLSDSHLGSGEKFN